MTHVRLVVLALALVVVGCASAPTAEGERSRRDPNRITAAEIEPIHYTTAYELVQALRPSWLQTRGTISFQDPTAGKVVVYLDGTRIGRAEQLRQIRTSDVGSIQYLSGNDASVRFGLGHMGGAILVSSRIGR